MSWCKDLCSMASDDPELQKELQESREEQERRRDELKQKFRELDLDDGKEDGTVPFGRLVAALEKDGFNRTFVLTVLQCLGRSHADDEEVGFEEFCKDFSVFKPEDLATMTKIKKLFEDSDADGDGRITREEMTLAANKGILSVDGDIPAAFKNGTMDDIFERIDIDNDGTITWGEFVQAYVMDIKEEIGLREYLLGAPHNEEIDHIIYGGGKYKPKVVKMDRDPVTTSNPTFKGQEDEEV